MILQRRTSMNSDTYFKCPLVVFKINNEKAYNYSIKIIEHLLDIPFVNEIFVEDMSLLNVDIILKYKISIVEQNININNLNLDINLSNIKTTDTNQQNYKINKFDLKTSKIDLCIVIGGDGTTLWASNLFSGETRPPFLTFNLGNLGYMAIYSCDTYKNVLNELYDSKKLIIFEKRALIKCTISNIIKQEIPNNDDCHKPEELKYTEIDKAFETFALNDIVLERSQGAHMINLIIYLNNELLTCVRCDGLILSTSTGSTAYSLSAGGTLIHYDVDAILLNAICPHSLSFRSIAFPRDIKLKIIPCTSSSNTVVLTHDGMEHIAVSPNQLIEASLSDIYVNFIVLENLVKNRVHLWKQKIVDQLGWNNAFKNID